MIEKIIVQLQTTKVLQWHNESSKNEGFINFLGVVEKQHFQNFLLWHEEDKARNPKASDAKIASVKIKIDKLNAERNRLIEIIDDYFIKYCNDLRKYPENNQVINSETFGSIIDKLSILSLKIYHTEEQIKEKGKEVGKPHPLHIDDIRKLITNLYENLNKLKIQQDNLQESLRKINNFEMGFHRYKQYKMYNDENLNPEIYNNK